MKPPAKPKKEKNDPDVVIRALINKGVITDADLDNAKAELDAEE